MNIKNHLEDAISELEKLIQGMDAHPILREAQTLIGAAHDAITSGNLHQMYSILAAIWLITMRVRGVLLASLYDGPDPAEDLRDAIDSFDGVVNDLQAEVYKPRESGFNM
ncbi:hypothetical protein [Stenotrophomonas maltophilia]|uniref:hypothetical protein n=1 Tax=Stenotrophomonas maltophilia TaxID=40324 RepID=UPI0013DA3F58|nr:hypothetical protein [Stenotrophomonas maltophilia]